MWLGWELGPNTWHIVDLTKRLYYYGLILTVDIGVAILLLIIVGCVVN